MSEFSASWLALREPFDAAARPAQLCAELTRHLPSAEPLRVLDLGCGTAANLRYLAPRLVRRQHWTLIDRDAELLTRAASNAKHLLSRRLDVVTACLDLVSQFDRVPWESAQLVTGSALLDLVSETWLAGLVERIAATGACALFALNYDGHFACTPSDRDDERVRTLFNRHQRGTKAFGPALGPGAIACAAALLEAAGYRVRILDSPWHIPSEALAMQRSLLHGWATAAVEIAPDAASEIMAWRLRREAWLEAGASTLVVGHQDLAAWPGIKP